MCGIYFRTFSFITCAYVWAEPNTAGCLLYRYPRGVVTTTPVGKIMTLHKKLVVRGLILRYTSGLKSFVYSLKDLSFRFLLNPQKYWHSSYFGSSVLLKKHLSESSLLYAATGRMGFFRPKKLIKKILFTPYPMQTSRVDAMPHSILFSSSPLYRLQST